MRKLLSLAVMALLVATLGACEDQPTNPRADTSVHGAAILNATADIEAVSSTAASVNGFSPGDDVGTVAVTDDRAQQVLTVEGTANGLNDEVDLTKDDGDGLAGHVSLFYDVESPATGPEACEPALGLDGAFDQDEVLSLAQMEIGPGDPPISLWDVRSDGSATLGPVEMTAPDEKYIKVERIGTVSIRDLRVNDGFGPDAVVGCGDVTVQ